MAEGSGGMEAGESSADDDDAGTAAVQWLKRRGWLGQEAPRFPTGEDAGGRELVQNAFSARCSVLSLIVSRITRKRGHF
jgi:hypothetical protein